MLYYMLIRQDGSRLVASEKELTGLPYGCDRPATVKATGERFHWGYWYCIDEIKQLGL